MPTPRNKTVLLNWAVTTGRIPPHMRATWATRFVIDEPELVERALIAQKPSGRTPDHPVPRAWASVAATVTADDAARPVVPPPPDDPTDYPTHSLTPGERSAIERNQR